MPNRFFIRCVSATHEFWYRLTGGAIGGRFGRAPILLLTTKGRRSGKERTTPLLYYRDGENLVIIASNGGDDRHPAWWLNLRDMPEARVQVGRQEMAVRAEKAGPEEKARLWPLLTEMYPQYDAYQKQTKRDIPVVVLTPKPAR